MRVLIDDRRAVYAPNTGIGRFGELLLRGLTTQSDVDVVLTTRSREALGGAGVRGTAHFSKLIADQLGIPLVARRRRVDVVHALWHELPSWTARKLVVSVHDLSVLTAPQEFSQLQRGYYGRLLTDAGRHARVVVVPSNATASDMYSRFPDARVAVVPYPLHPDFVAPAEPGEDRRTLRSLDLQRGRFLLYSSGLARRKGTQTLFAAIGALQRSGEFSGPLVVTGAHRIRRDVDCTVREVGELSNRELAGLYRGAAATVVSSRHEGFCYPAAEAVACGCPLVCPTEGAAPETAGTVATLHEAGNADSLAQAVLDAVETDSDMAAMRAKAAREAPERFSVDKAASRFASCYRLASE